jgi:hypothetical protein
MSSRRASKWGVAVAVLAVAGSLGVARAEEKLTPERDQDIRHLLEITNATSMSADLATSTSKQLVDMLKAANVPERGYDIVRREVKAVADEQGPALLDQVVALYARHFSADEIRQLVTFYESPLGRKTVAEMPQIMEDTFALGQAWNKKTAPMIDRRVTAALTKEGLLPQKAPAGPASPVAPATTAPAGDAKKP